MTDQTEIGAIRALLGAKPRPVGWDERRRRIEEVGGAFPLADDIALEAVDCDGVPGEWSLAPGQRREPRAALFPWRRLLLGLDRQPPHARDRGRPRRRYPHPRGRLSPRAGTSVSGRARGCPQSLRLPARPRHSGRADRGRRRQCRRRADAGPAAGFARRGRGTARLRLAHLALDRPDADRRDAGDQGRRRSADPSRLSGRTRRRLPAERLRRTGTRASRRSSPILAVFRPFS